MNFNEVWSDTISSVSKAISTGDLKLVRKLIRQGKPIDVSDNRGWRSIHQAAVLKNSNPQLILEELLKHEDIDINWQTHEGETAMLLSCKHNIGDSGYKLVEMLLRYKADPNIPDNEDETPILAAARSGQTNIVKLLASHDCVNVNKCDFGGWTPLHEAATRGDVDMLKTLLNASGILNNKDECGMTPLFTAAQHGRYDCLKILIEAAIAQDQNYLIDEGANDGASPLMIAAQQGFTECIQLLISSGANPNKYANDGVNALHLAAECGHAETLTLLLKYMNIHDIAKKLNPNRIMLKIRNPLHLAIRNLRKKCLQVMLESHFPVDSIDYIFEQKFSMAMSSPKYITSLGLAISLNLIETVQLLLKYGANTNTYHPNIYAPLHCAFSVIDYEFERDTNISLEILNLILKNGADVNHCRSQEEPNELIHSIFNPTFLKLLLKYGLDLRTCFKQGYINRFLALSLHTVTLDWYYNVLPNIFKFIERNEIVRDHFTALAQHIESTYRLRFEIDEYNPLIWAPIMDLFDTPHTLKEVCRFFIRRKVYQHVTKEKLFPHLIKTLDVPTCLHNYLLFKVI